MRPFNQYSREIYSILRVGFTWLAAVSTFVAGYVWFIMSLSSLGAPDRAELGVDYTWALALDTVCLLLLIFILCRPNTKLMIVGLAIVAMSFALRLGQALDANGQTFWLEPYLRSGIYALAFAFTYVAAILRRHRATIKE